CTMVRVPKLAASVDRVIKQQSTNTDSTGTNDSFNQDADNPSSARPFLINGERRPRIVMRRGEVQNWHFINAAIFNFANLGVDDHALHVYSHDGNPRRDILVVSANKDNGVVLAPGNRVSALF